MKKLVSLLLAVCMCLSISATLTACEEEHSHTYKTEWAKDTTHHWHACEGEDCTDVADKAEHAFTDGVCSVCGYEQPAPTPSANEVTEEQFYAALSFVGATSYTITAEEKSAILDADDTTVVRFDECSGTIYVDGNKLFCDLEYVEGNEIYDMEMFVEDTEDGSYVYMDMGEGFVKLNIDELGFELDLPISISAGFEEGFIDRSRIEYDDFTYKNGKYVGKMKADINDDRLVDVVLQFEDGKLIYVEINDGTLYGLDADEIFSKYTFYNFGTTTVTLPENYIDMVTPDTDSWASYFEFDNVTATKTQTQVYTEDDISGEVVQVQKIEIADSKWLLNRESTYGAPGSSITLTDTVYFDGQNAYCDGVLNTDLNSENEGFFFGADFSVYESSFTETATGVFEADEISVYGVYTYTDVCITIRDGKIVSIEYTMNVSESYENYSATISYMFDLWGDTTIDGEKYTQPSAWASYFDFENVTITQGMYHIVDGTVQNSSLGVEWKVDGDTWVSQRKMKSVDGVVTQTNEVYYDGTNYYLNGTIVNKDEVEHYHYLHAGLLGSLIGYENLFNSTTEGSKIIYTADSIDFYNIIFYTDIELVVDDGKITKLTYTEKNAVYNENTSTYYDGTFTLTFSDYGTTVVAEVTE